MPEQIYTTRKLQRRFFGFKVERPQAAPGKVLVLTGGGAPITLWPNQKPTAGEAAWNRYDTLIEIDTGKRDFTFTTPVPAKGGDVSFQMTFSASYCVSDPLRVLNEGLMNPEPALRRVVTESASRITEKYDIENAQGAVAEVREMLEKNKYTEKLPFELSAINVKLDLDNQAREYLSKRRQQVREADLARNAEQLVIAKAGEQGLRQQYDHQQQGAQNKHELELEKQKAQAQLELEKQQAQIRLELDRQKMQTQLELEKQKAEYALEIQKMRIAVYRPIVQGGMWDMLLLRLGENPNDVVQVSELIMQMHGQQLAADVAVLEAMIKGDRIEDRHLKDVTADLVRRLRSNTAGNAPALTAMDQRQLPGDQDKPQAASAPSEGAQAE